MSGFQSPQVLTDLYRDLRDRRLLPLVLVLVVGLAVVPIALSSDAATPPASAPSAAAAAVPVAKQSNAPTTEVVVSDPGLRDYRRRLSRDPKDPFVQLYTSPDSDLGASALTGASSVEPVGGTESVGTVAPGGTTGGVTDAAPTVVQTKVQTDTKVVFYRLKVRTGPVGGEMNTRDEVGPSAQLPSKVVPALVFLGANFNGDLEAQRAYFMVSNGVSSLSGDGVCSLGDPCQLLSIKPGQYADFIWTDGLAYRVKLLAFKRHIRDQVPGEFGTGDGSGEGTGSANG